MSELDRFRAGVNAPPESARDVGLPQRASRRLPISLAGTTTTCSAAVALLAARHNLPALGYLEVEATLQREPNNPVDPNAVAVLVEGERIGYLPGWVARAHTVLPPGAARTAPVQIFTALQDGALRALAWIWLHDVQPRWEYDATKRAPVTREEKRAHDHAYARASVRRRMAEDGRAEAQTAAGMVMGVHYSELVEPIQQLKREGRLEEALELCYAAIAGAEGAAAVQGDTPPSLLYTAGLDRVAQAQASQGRGRDAAALASACPRGPARGFALRSSAGQAQAAAPRPSSRRSIEVAPGLSRSSSSPSRPSRVT